MMSGTEESLIVLDTDSELNTDSDVKEMQKKMEEEMEKDILLTVLQTKGSPLKLICTKHHW